MLVWDEICQITTANSLPYRCILRMMKLVCKYFFIEIAIVLDRLRVY